MFIPVWVLVLFGLDLWCHARAVDRAVDRALAARAVDDDDDDDYIDPEYSRRWDSMMAHLRSLPPREGYKPLFLPAPDEYETVADDAYETF